MLDTAAIVLAAGSSSRMGRAKQMLELDGIPLVRRAAAAAIACGCSPVVVVLGARAAQIAPALDGVGVAVAVNPDWQRGLGTSIAAGVACVERSDAGAALLTLADQPLVGPATLDRLLAARRDARKPIAAARYAGTAGVPACFTRALFPLLRALDGASGCKALLRAHLHDAVLVDCPEAELDLDTPEDYARLLGDRAGCNAPPHRRLP